jgi:hypothetical protein
MDPHEFEFLLILTLAVFVFLLLLRLVIISNFGITGNRKKYLGTGAAIKSAIIRYDQLQDRTANPYYSYFAAALVNDNKGKLVFPVSGNPSLFIHPTLTEKGSPRYTMILPSVLEVALDKTQDRIKNKTLTAATAMQDYKSLIRSPDIQAKALQDMINLDGAKDGFIVSDVRPDVAPLCCSVQGRCPANSVDC